MGGVGAFVRFVRRIGNSVNEIISTTSQKTAQAATVHLSQKESCYASNRKKKFHPDRKINKLKSKKSTPASNGDGDYVKRSTGLT